MNSQAQRASSRRRRLRASARATLARSLLDTDIPFPLGADSVSRGHPRRAVVPVAAERAGVAILDQADGVDRPLDRLPAALPRDHDEAVGVAVVAEVDGADLALRREAEPSATRLRRSLAPEA